VAFRVDNFGMLALSIRQPFAELILRGAKSAELRSKNTNIVGQRFYLYAARAKASLPVWSTDLEISSPPSWMVELAGQLKLIDPEEVLPTGLLVGTAVIDRVDAPREASDLYHWHLTEVERLAEPLKPARQPQPVWFRPF
jgi:hypothetical protein